MAVLKINNKWYVTGDSIKVETVIPLQYSYVQKGKDIFFGYAAHNEVIYPLIGFSSKMGDTAVLITVKDRPPFAIAIEDISFDNDVKAEATLSELLSKLF